MRIVLAVGLALLALAALFFVVAGIYITVSGMRARRGVKGDIALTGFFVVCFILAAGAFALIAFQNSTEPTEVGSGSHSKPPSPDQPGTEAERAAGEKTGNETIARSEPPGTPDPSLAFGCKDFTSQGAAQKALDQQLEDQNALDPDADGTACEALDVPDPEPKPDPEKDSEKEPDLGKRSESKKKPEQGSKPASKKEPQREEEPEPEKKR